MASGTETICYGLTDFHELWAVPIELAIATWLLERQLGLAFLGPAGVAFISTTGILLMAKHIGKAQKIWIQGIQTRVNVTASTLASIKDVKMLGFTDTISGIVQTL
ncbi:hypothetical protein M430DRAFT_48867 [Amorphotheca resinae ATCC 22711]|uniref:Uncharacterized protein n=1 Tax=Amorphotheca resinae ATCC 22711 TaxID=857342 RepID=A0A2T3B8V9_AMORE|nr:hypothetical protein M430DRAFT_48867 [Amorphotheca resinae ATCC 22711]PSS23283.1 hypothetical protein M430DRAFT_48867 [Amorphotheca resinae ATCC 22711]